MLQVGGGLHTPTTGILIGGVICSGHLFKGRIAANNESGWCDWRLLTP
jgi:hypothetical protein